MKLSWVNDGAEFRPRTTMGQAKRLAEAERAFNEKKGSMVDLLAAKSAFLASVLSKTDPDVTPEVVEENVELHEMEDLCAQLITEPLLRYAPRPRGAPEAPAPEPELEVEAAPAG